MININLIDTSGLRQTLQATEGQSLMQVAVSAGVRGIVGECGGSAMCATCHVYVDDEFTDQLLPPSETELEMLECTANERLPNSRLSCQIKLSAAQDGLVVRLPERQQ